MSCGGTLIKILLIVFNFLLLGVSMFVVYLGVQTMQFEKDTNLKDLIDMNLQTGSLVLIGVGGIMAVICAIGFIGACCESGCMLNFYGLLMFLLLLGNLALIFTGYRYKDTVEERFDAGISNGISKFRQDTAIAVGLQKFQRYLKCCGWKGPEDYKGSDVPASCCDEEVPTKEPQKTCQRPEIKFHVGCQNSPVVKQFAGTVLYSAVAGILIQLIIILAACCLARDIRSVASDWD